MRTRKRARGKKRKARCALTAKAPCSDAVALGHRLRDARIAAGLTCKHVAELIQYDRQSLYRWQWGVVEPDLTILRELARLYGTTVGWLANGEGDAPAISQSA